MSRPAPRLVFFTAAALGCFAANSILCRRALAPRLIDAASFTAVRIVAGAVTLALILGLRGGGARGGPARGSSVAGAVALFIYAAAFSFAYLRIPAAVGALVLFGAVQLTMIGWAVRRGERPTRLEWLGLAVAAVGLVALTRPGWNAPDTVGTAAMAVAGVAWGAYSLLGRGAGDPLAATAWNFARAVPLALVLAAALWTRRHGSTLGVALAATSGALASGVGYSLWYAALRSLSATRAAILQLAVPALAALAGMVFLGERLSARVVGAGSVILAGVATAVLSRRAR